MELTDLSGIYKVLADSNTFRGRKVKVHSIYNSHPEEKCFLIETDPQSFDFKIRFTTPTSKLSAATEYSAFKLMQLNNICGTPQIYEYHPENPAYLITDYKKGFSLDKSLLWVSFAREIVAELHSTLSDIHKLEGDFFGHLGRAQYASWQEFLDERFWKHTRNVFETGILSSDNMNKIRLLYEDAVGIFRNTRPILLHGDVKPANIVFDPESKIVTLIDFELARFGDPDFEWIRAYYLSKRWPEYRQLISEPLLDLVDFRFADKIERSAAVLVYSLYHLCSVIAFEYKKRITVPQYRLEDLRYLLKIVYERYK